MFRSFFLAGFQGSTGHDRTVDSDYAELARRGIHAVRECVRWSLIDLGLGKYDFSSLDPFVRAANRHRVEVIWDLFHYGYPTDLDPLGREFQLRFADYCFEAGRYIGDHSRSEICWFAPVSEPSFLAAAAGEKGLFAPHLAGKGWDFKVALCRAAIAGIEALWVGSPECRIVNVDSLCRVVAPADRPDLEEHAARRNETWAFQAWDILSGRLLPELGGSSRHLDVVGLHYDWSNQWELGAERLGDRDPLRWSPADLVRSVWTRYGHEMIVSETAHDGEHRGRWLREVAAEAASLLEDQVPLSGVCLDPILGMLDGLGEAQPLDRLLRERSQQVQQARAGALLRPSALVRGRGRY